MGSQYQYYVLGIKDPELLIGWSSIPRIFLLLLWSCDDVTAPRWTSSQSHHVAHWPGDRWRWYWKDQRGKKKGVFSFPHLHFFPPLSIEWGEKLGIRFFPPVFLHPFLACLHLPASSCVFLHRPGSQGKRSTSELSAFSVEFLISYM